MIEQPMQIQVESLISLLKGSAAGGVWVAIYGQIGYS